MIEVPENLNQELKKLSQDMIGVQTCILILLPNH